MTWLLEILMIAGWGCAWAIGLSAVYYFSPFWGWVFTGTAGGLVTAVILHQVRPSPLKKQMLAVFLGWLAGGICSASVTHYNVMTGWLTMGILGGVVTGATVAGTKGARKSVPALRAVLAAIGWVVGGVTGVSVGSTGGLVVGSYLGSAIGGRTAPLIVWAIAWAIQGGITGAVGGAVMSWQLRRG